jgi:hypothetical protein
MALEAPTKLEQGVGPQSAVVGAKRWDGLRDDPRDAHFYWLPRRAAARLAIQRMLYCDSR